MPTAWEVVCWRQFVVFGANIFMNQLENIVEMLWCFLGASSIFFVYFLFQISFYNGKYKQASPHLHIFFIEYAVEKKLIMIQGELYLSFIFM